MAVNPFVWFQLHLAKYPASAGTDIYRWAFVPMADANATTGWKEGRLISISDIDRSATDQDGNYQRTTVRVELDDSDGLLRGLAAAATTQYFAGREAAIYLLSEAGRAAGTTPRPLFRGVLTRVQPKPGRTFVIECDDLVGSSFSGFNLDKTIPTVLATEVSTTVAKADQDKYLPIIFGEHSDAGATDVNLANAEKGLLPVIDLGDIDVTGGTTPNPTLSPPDNFAVTVVGTPGTDTLTYAISTISPYGESPYGTPITITNAPNVRDASNYVKLTWNAVTGAIAYRVWGRTTSPPQTWLDGMNNNGTWVDPETEYHDDHDQDIEKSMTPPSTNTATTNGNFWGHLAVSIGTSDVHAVYASDLAASATPKRIKLEADTENSEWMTADSAGWPYANRYLETNGIRYTVILMRGARLQHHRDGAVTVGVNGCGYEEVGDGTGDVVDDAFPALQLMLNEFVLKNGGTGYRSGDWGPLETYTNGDTQLKTTAFAAAQTITVSRIGGTGYKAAWALHEPITVREFVRRFCLSFDARLAVDHHGRILPIVIDDMADPTVGRLYRDHVDGVELEDQTLAYDEIENRIVYSYDWDSDARVYRVAGQIVEDADSIAAHVPGGVIGTEDTRGVHQGPEQELYCVRDPVTATDSRARRLTRNKRAPHYVVPGTDGRGLEDDLGAQIRLTHYDGLGTDGETESPVLTLGHRIAFSAPTGLATALTGLDIGRIATEAAPALANDNTTIILRDDATAYELR